MGGVGRMRFWTRRIFAQNLDFCSVLYRPVFQSCPGICPELPPRRFVPRCKMGKELERTVWVAVGRQELERCFARELGIWQDVVGVQWVREVVSSWCRGCGRWRLLTF